MMVGTCQRDATDGVARRSEEAEMRFFNHMREHTTAVFAILISGYHPERHYMRGPGPACAARAARMAILDGLPTKQPILH
jgi:hypothetical protein